MSSTKNSSSFSSQIYRVKIVGNEDPQRPSWVSDDIKLADHPPTYAGYLTRHFYGKSIAVGTEIPSWTYDTISSYGLDGASFSGNPSSSGPIPNTQGVYQAQEWLLNGNLLWYSLAAGGHTYQSDIDVLRLWPLGRPNTVGGFPPGLIYVPNDNPELDSQVLKTGPEIVSQGAASSDCNDPTTALYYISYLGSSGANNMSLRDYPKVNPSYAMYFGYSWQSELYPIVPHLGTWTANQRDLGMVNRPGSTTTSWEWTTKTAATAYGKFYDKWFQNMSHAVAPGYVSDVYTLNCYNDVQEDTNEAMARYPYGCCPSEGSGTNELTKLIAIGSFTEWDTTKSSAWNRTNMAPSAEEEGLQITTTSTVDSVFPAQTSPGDPYLEGHLGLWSSNTNFRLYEDSMLLDELWGGTYYTGGFYIENRGLAYHLRNAVKWDNLGDQPTIGGIKLDSLYGGGGSYGRYRDGNYGPIPPTMTFNGGGEATWSSSIKNTFPYSNYLDWDEETGKLGEYYSNTSKYLKCEILDGQLKGQNIYVSKPTGLIIEPESGASQRVCPEYFLNDELFVLGLLDPDYIDDGGDIISAYFRDLNISSRQVLTYDTGEVTLEPYHDYFPDTYIPLETSFLLPETQRIPNYSFNCSSMSGQYSPRVYVPTYGSQGEKGYKGGVGCTSTYQPVGEKGAMGIPGTVGEGGEKGAAIPGGAGEAGESADKGAKGAAGEVGAKGAPGSPGDRFGGDKGPPGVDIITGSWGTVVGNPTNYTTSSAGTMEIILGDANISTLGSTYSTTISFSRRFFGVCVEDGASQPNYTGMWVYASDFIDT